MEESSDHVFARVQGAAVQFRVLGRVTADHSPALRRFAEAALAAGCTSVAIELGDCTNFDSTFLGTLLILRRRMEAREPAALVLAASSPPCLRILRSTGVARLFAFRDEGLSGDEPWRRLDSELDRFGPREFQENIVAAHQELAQVGGPLAERYRDIAELIAGELKASEAPRGGDAK